MGYPIYHSQYTAAQIEAAIGKGPRVNTAGYWEVWNVGTGAYESTGVGAGVTPPTVVTQVSQMTNHGYIYIYNGTETGYTAGYWYYWDGSAWTAGGAYQVAATDPTLTVAGAAADAKATGDAVGELKSALDKNVNYRTLTFTAYQGAIGGAGQGAGIANATATPSTTRIRSFETVDDKRNIMLSAMDSITISCDEGYQYAYQVYDTTSLIALDVFEWKTAEYTVSKNSNVWFMVSFSKTDLTDIVPSEISHLHITYDGNGVKTKIAAIEADMDESVPLPFAFIDEFKVYKHNGKYCTNFTPQSKALSESTGVVVYLSPSGDNSNDGLTVATPKKTFGSALGVSNVQTIILLPGTYTAGTHFSAGQQITTPLNIVGIGDVTIDSGEGLPLRFYRTLYIENVKFVHGQSALIVDFSDASRYVTLYKCTFADSYRNNGVSISGGTAYVVECTANGNAYDGFNYHKNGTIINRAIEIDCKAYGNGTYNLDGSDGQSSNGSTTHDGSYIVRVNGEYECCHGGVVADKEAYSVNYGCKAGVSTVTDSANYPDRMSNYWCSYGHMWLYDCVSFGSKYDTAVVNGGVITADVTYPLTYPT